MVRTLRRRAVVTTSISRHALSCESFVSMFAQLFRSLFSAPACSNPLSATYTHHPPPFNSAMVPMVAIEYLYGSYKLF